ncbi:urease accessory protein UreD [Synechocystis salina LEGE 00031]|uniref:Urease accessory protein UreD n=2 Tax=Synechocystis TaxID=1142 RepID=A0ABR9VRQ1_9SYNC|nr:urease accessory protein UreD [Synechocystis salina]MBE9241332.1 urease accessory protein UreD [Synechocystis salina LEGE 00041]MBE9254030.1 urease accessory protein UreD [Synechocystis salina LEGE 00031]
MITVATVDNSAPWQANLWLRYDRPGHRTRMVECLVQAPLKVQRSFYPDNTGQCQTMLLHTGGGMVGGDRLGYDVVLEAQSDVCFTSASAGKIYRSLGPWSEQRVNLEVGVDASVLWCPQETIIFDQARYQQNFSIRLQEQARFKGWEIVRLGRTARGEKFTQGHWRSSWEIWQGERLIWGERQQLIGAEQLYESPNALAGFTCLGTYVDLSRSFDQNLVNQAREMINGQGQSPQFGLSLTATQGLIARYRGDSTQEAKNIFTQLSQFC